MRSCTRAIAIVSTAIMVAACSEADVVVSEVATEPVPTTDPALVELSPPTSVMAPATSPADEAPTVSSGATGTGDPEHVRIAAWDWGAPCRVPVTQYIGETIKFERTFDLMVSDAVDGYRFDFGNVAVNGADLDGDSALFLANRLAVLPSIVLDDRGRFLRFDGLENELRELEALVGEPLGFDRDFVAAVEPIIRSGTFEPWFGFWLERNEGEINDVTIVETREFAGVEYPAEVTVSGAVFGSELRVAEFGEHAARFSYLEVGADVSSVGGGPIALQIEATAIIDMRKARPFESTVRTILFSTADGRRVDSYYDIAVETEFDWENAEGCE